MKNNTHFKFLCLFWFVLGQFGLTHNCNSDSEEVLKFINKLSEGMDDRSVVKSKLIELKGYMKRMNEERRTQEGDEEWIKDYRKIARVIKIRDWLVDLEKHVFPTWLLDASISCYYKWAIALFTVETKFFDDLRVGLKKREIPIEQFATEISSIYDKIPEIFAHCLPSIPKPHFKNLKTFCDFFGMDNSEAAVFACEVVMRPFGPETKTIISINKSTKSVSPITSTPKIHSTKFFIFVINIKKSAEMNVKRKCDDINTKIQDTIQRSKIKYNMMQSNFLPGNNKFISPNEREKRLHLPGMFFHVDLQLDLDDETNPEFDSNFDKYDALKANINDEIKSEDHEYDVLIIDDYVLTATFPPFTHTPPAPAINPFDDTTQLNKKGR